MRIVLHLILILIAPFLFAQKVAQPSPILLTNTWNAKWIAPREVALMNYGVFHFRKTFNLASLPSSFVINISADNRYRLFVNGKSVCSGPARGDLQHWPFETIDIAEFLSTGKNTVSVQVWNFGEQMAWAQISHQTGLIIQGNSESERIVDTNESWKVIENTAYNPVASIAHITGPGDQVFAQRYPWGWKKIDTNDDAWPNAIISEDAVPFNAALKSERKLITRKIPLMEEVKQRMHSIKRFEGVTVGDNFLKGNEPLKLNPWTTATILIDQQELTTAFPELIVSGGRGSKITMTYSEALVDKISGEKGNRNDVKGKVMELRSDHDVFILEGGASRLFRPLTYRTFRYVEIKIENHQEELTLHDLYSVFTAYPFAENASFKSSDASLQPIWNVGWNTARLCAYETYMDCPYYEQLQYVGDTRIQALVSLYVSGDDRLMRNAIEQFHHSIFDEGLTKSRYPDHRGQVIPPFSLFWIGMIHDYWMLRDDPEFIKTFLPEIRRVLAWHEKQIDAKTNMLGKMKYWNFVDWPTEWPWKGHDEVSGIPAGTLEGGSSILTLQYVDALKNAAELFDAFQMKKEASIYKSTSERLINGTNKLCWDANRNLLADSPEKKEFSQHANTWAVLTDIVKPREQAAFITKIWKDTSLIQCTFYYRFYLNKALVKAGLGDTYTEFLQPWRNMVALGLTTFAERPEPTRSDCHAWSASPNYNVLATVCGIQPASPGFKTVKIEPHFGNLTWIEGEMPHPFGKIKVKLSKSKTGVDGEITLPKGLQGEFVWNGIKVNLNEGTQQVEINK